MSYQLPINIESLLSGNAVDYKTDDCGIDWDFRAYGW